MTFIRSDSFAVENGVVARNDLSRSWAVRAGLRSAICFNVVEVSHTRCKLWRPNDSVWFGLASGALEFSGLAGVVKGPTALQSVSSLGARRVAHKNTTSA